MSLAEVKALWDALPDGMLLVGADGRIVDANVCATEMFGGDTPLAGTSVDELVPNDFRTRHRALHEGFVALPSTRSMAEGRRLLALRRSGEHFPVTIALSPLPDEAIEPTIHVVLPVTLVAVRDVSEMTAAEAVASQAEQRRLLAEEHQRVARDLHDSVIQQLFALGMGLSATHNTASDPEVSERIRWAVGELDRVITEIRSVIFDMTPAHPIATTTRALIGDLVLDLSDQLDLNTKIRFVGDVDGEVSDAVAEHAVAVVRKTLTNIARHAHATEVSVVVSAGAAIELRVTDNGTGIPSHVIKRSGLRNLRERAEMLGGDLAVDSSPNGTIVSWRVPRSAS